MSILPAGRLSAGQRPAESIQKAGKTMKSLLHRMLLSLLTLSLVLTFHAAFAESFQLPADTQIIEAQAFLDCRDLTGLLRIPDGVETVGESAFAGCTGLTGLELPDSLTAISAHAFDGCTGLTGTLYVPQSVQMDPTAFDNCPNLTVIRTTETIKVAVMTDEGGIEDGSLNQALYTAAKSFCDAHGLELASYPGDKIEKAVQEGANVLAFTSFVFEDAVAEAQTRYPDVRFICTDMSIEDPGENVFCAVYREDQAGFLAGYAAVRLGFTRLGFLGGMEIPAIVRYSQGFTAGAQTAADELGITQQFSMTSAYAQSFAPTPEAAQTVKTWYENGVQAVFCCGGGLWQSAAAAAGAVPGAKLIGVDVDQKAAFDEYAPGATVTSAVKAVGTTLTMALTKITEGSWADLSGKVLSLGIVSADPSENHVQLAASTQFGSGFTAADYGTLIARLLDGTYSTQPDAAEEVVVQDQAGLQALGSPLTGKIRLIPGSSIPVDLTWPIELQGELIIKAGENAFSSLRIREGGSLTLSRESILGSVSNWTPEGPNGIAQIWVDGGTLHAESGIIREGSTVYVTSGTFTLPESSESAYVIGGAKTEDMLETFLDDPRFNEIFLQASMTLSKDTALTVPVQIMDGSDICIGRDCTVRVLNTLNLTEGTLTVLSGGQLILQGGEIHGDVRVEEGGTYTRE